MLKKARAEAVLAPLTSVIEGTVSDRRLWGSYQGYEVEAWPMRQRPSPDAPNPEGASSQGPLVNIFVVRLVGISGSRFWPNSPTDPNRSGATGRSVNLAFRISG